MVVTVAPMRRGTDGLRNSREGTGPEAKPGRQLLPRVSQGRSIAHCFLVHEPEHGAPQAPHPTQGHAHKLASQSMPPPGDPQTRPQSPSCRNCLQFQDPTGAPKHPPVAASRPIQMAFSQEKNHWELCAFSLSGFKASQGQPFPAPGPGSHA